MVCQCPAVQGCSGGIAAKLGSASDDASANSEAMRRPPGLMPGALALIGTGRDAPTVSFARLATDQYA
jgi:hypothetical protein